MREHDVADAARLLAFALRPRQYAGQSVAYTQLLGRYRTEEEFAAAFHALVEGLDLRVLDVTDRAVVVGAGIESPFAFKLSEYHKSDKPPEERRVLRGLILLGIAAFCFPTARALEETDLPHVTAREVDDFLRTACTTAEQSATGEDRTPAEPGLELARQLYARQASVKGTERKRRGRSATIDLIEQALDDMKEWGLVREETQTDRLRRFRALPRFRIQVRMLGSQYAFTALRGLGGDAAGAAAQTG
jgi:hypothetical protein